MNTRKGASRVGPIHLALFLIFLLHNKVIATNFYVDPSSTASISTGTYLNPWKTIAQVNNGTANLYPGDTVFFKKNQTYSGRLNITRSGSATFPIVYTNYGEGNLPEFNNAFSNVINLYGQQYVIIDGIKIIDKSISPTDHTIQAKTSYAINVGNSPNNTIRNCDISLVGVAINVTSGSNNTTITGNKIHNLRMVWNTPSSVNSDDDYGANPMVIGSSNNTISNNRFEECWAISYDYGYDGGAIELFGSYMSNNKIMYNTAINCNGFIEIGSSTNGIAENNIIAYNKIINCGTLGVYQNGINFRATIKNIQYYNNTIVETIKKYSNPGVMFWMSGTGSAGMVVLKNNIFWLSSGVNLASEKFNYGQMVHMYNVYRMEKGTLGLTLDNSERLSSKDIHFTKVTEDPSTWDFNLVQNSTAIDIGINLGYEKDFSGSSIQGNPDAGILEFKKATLINNVKNECNAGMFYTNTTCAGYQYGITHKIPETICYNTMANKIVSMAPDQFTYYTTITAPLAEFCIDIYQLKSNPTFNHFGVLQKTQIYLWNNECNKISSGLETNVGQSRICVSNASPGNKYVLSIQYEGINLIGKSFSGTAPSCQYIFESRINGNAIAGSSISLNLVSNCGTETTKQDTTVITPPNPINDKNKENNFDMTLSPTASSRNFTLNIAGDLDKISTIRIVDMSGRVLKVLKVKGTQTLVIGEELIQGLYTVEASQGSEKVLLRMLKL